MSQTEDYKIGVHVTHCCIDHGCKYGDQDCPVADGSHRQANPCEHCPPTFNHQGDYTAGEWYPYPTFKPHEDGGNERTRCRF